MADAAAAARSGQERRRRPRDRQSDAARQGLQVAKLEKLRLHVRAIVRDGAEVFIGSQSCADSSWTGGAKLASSFAIRAVAKQSRPRLRPTGNWRSRKRKTKTMKSKRGKDKEVKAAS
jgi:hypothetical protein